MLLVEMGAPLITILIYRTGASFPGWNIYEALLVQGSFSTAKGLLSPFSSGLSGILLSGCKAATGFVID